MQRNKKVIKYIYSSASNSKCCKKKNHRAVLINSCKCKHFSLYLRFSAIKRHVAAAAAALLSGRNCFGLAFTCQIKFSLLC